MVAQVAGDEPHTAAKIPHANTFTCSSRPGSLVTHGHSPSNICEASLVRNRISPIQINIGNAVRAQLEDPPHIVVAMIFAAGAAENDAMPMYPMTRSVDATQRPEDSSTRARSRSIAPKVSGSI